MRQVSSRRRQRQRGNAILEFALASTLLLTLFVGVTGFSRIFNIANMAQGAAQAGVQYASLSPAHLSLTLMQTAALNDTGNYPGASAVASQWCTCSVGGPTIGCSSTCGNGGALETYVQVQVTIPYTTVINYPMLPNPVNITQSACARVQ